MSRLDQEASVSSYYMYIKFLLYRDSRPCNKKAQLRDVVVHYAMKLT